MYTTNPEVKFTLKNNSDKIISEADRIWLEQDITFNELSMAVNSMPNGKTPGMDGLPIEVYKVFWSRLGTVYHDSVLYSKERGSLNQSARRGLVTQIPKKDQDILHIPNWHPLTMLTCDYKILAKALAQRLQKVLPSVISTDQTGFMKGRNIATNIRKTIEVVEYTKQHNIPALIMVLDYQKCFDYIEHSAIWGCLEYFNFGPTFISWIQLLFKDIELCTQNNGSFSPFLTQLDL